MSILERRVIGKSGPSVTALGLGTSPLGGCGVPVSFEQFEQVVAAAYEQGVRYFDTAPLYGLGKSEHSLGHVLRTRKWRDQVTISTKVGRVLKPASRAPRAQSKYAIDWVDALPFVDEYDYSYDGIMRAFDDSQQRLGVDHIDVLLVHDIGKVWFEEKYDTYLKQLRAGGFKALDELRSSGSVKAIGLGVNETEAVLAISDEFQLDCSMVAGRYTLLNHEPAKEFFPECIRRGISIIAAGIFNSGILGEGSAGNRATRTYDCQVAPAAIVERVQKLESVCRQHGVSLPNAALQFVSRQPAVTCVVMGALSAEQVRSNVAGLTAEIPEVFWEDLEMAGLIPPVI